MKRGISLATLTIAMIVTLVIVTTVSITGVSVQNNSKKLKIASEIAFVQELVDNYYNEIKMYPTSSSITVNLQKVTNDSLIQFNDEEIIENKVILYEIDYSKLNKVDISYGKKENNDLTDVYAVSNKTGKVYYVKGFKTKDLTYYSLTDELMKKIDYKRNNNQIKNDDVTFIQSEEKYTNKNIDVIVKIANNLNFTNVSVKAIKYGEAPVTIPLQQNDKGVDIYNVTGIVGNYVVEVSYTKEAKTIKKIYEVQNYDSDFPNFTYTVTDLKNTDENISKKCINLNVEFDKSGIKYAKYETENITANKAKQYFLNNGYNINSNVIIVDSTIKNITIYYEDNAGNYKTQLITF